MWISVDCAIKFMGWYDEYVRKGGSTDDLENLHKAVPILRSYEEKIKDRKQVRDYIVEWVDVEERDDSRLENL